MATLHHFADSLKVGERGETLILDYLEKSTAVEQIIDVRDSKLYQEIDVDLLVKMRSGQELKIEIKTDTYTSGNIYYETISALETDSIGCFEKTEADYMFYFFMNLNTLYIIKMDEYKKWFNDKQELFDALGYQKRPKNSRYNGSTYTSVGYAFPVELLEDDSINWVSKVYIY